MDKSGYILFHAQIFCVLLGEHANAFSAGFNR